MTDNAADLERDLRETREHLSETVDALAAKLDVKSRAKESFASADKRKLGAVGRRIGRRRRPRRLAPAPVTG